MKITKDAVGKELVLGGSVMLVASLVSAAIYGPVDLAAVFAEPARCAVQVLPVIDDQDVIVAASVPPAPDGCAGQGIVLLTTDADGDVTSMTRAPLSETRRTIDLDGSREALTASTGLHAMPVS